MRDGQASVTAYRVAVRRAQHQLFDDPRVLDDPLAVRIVEGNETALRLRNPHDRHMRAFMAARSRYAEDTLAAAVRRGARQYVVLGAGLDTFAYRNPHAEEGLAVFEVDHPDTQAWKRHCLAEANIPIPGWLTFVPVDFERQNLGAELARSGFQMHAPAFFSWLGVTMYLSRETVLETLRFVHSICAANGIAFDYAVARSSLSWLHRIAFDSLAARVASTGEPFRGSFEPAELVNELRKIGFNQVENLDAAEINRRYFQNRSDGLRVRGMLARLMCACA